MPELFFAAMWLIPLVVTVLFVHRFAKHARMIHQHVKDPEAFAQVIREAVEASQREKGIDPDVDPEAIFAQLYRRESEDVSSGPDSERPSGIPEPFGEAESSGRGVVLIAAFLIGLAAALLLQA